MAKDISMVVYTGTRHMATVLYNIIHHDYPDCRSEVNAGNGKTTATLIVTVKNKTLGAEITKYVAGFVRGFNFMQISALTAFNEAMISLKLPR